MTIANVNKNVPGVGSGAVTVTPLSGYEIIEVNAGAVRGVNAIAAIADTALVDQSVTAAGTTQADAYVIGAQITNLTTVGSGSGVVLPTATKPGMKRTIFNSDATNAVQVYGNGSDTIDGTAGATGVPLTHAKRCAYYCVAVGKWISAQLGVVSA